METRRFSPPEIERFPVNEVSTTASRIHSTAVHTLASNSGILDAQNPKLVHRLESPILLRF